MPEAQLDRFLMRVSFGYPNADEEGDVLHRRLARQREEQTLDAVTDAADRRGHAGSDRDGDGRPTISRYCVDLAAATRTHQHVLVGASPRGALGLMLAARGLAVIARSRLRHVPEDVKAVAHPVLAHRLTSKPELWMTAVTGAQRRRRGPRDGPGALGPRTGLTCRPAPTAIRWSPAGVPRGRTSGPWSSRSPDPSFAVAFHRPDALVASTPLVVVAVWSVLTRPSGPVHAHQWLGRRSVREGER